MKEADRHCVNKSKLNFNTIELNNNKSDMHMYGSNQSLMSDVSSVASSGAEFSSRRFSENFDSREDLPEIRETNKYERSKSCAGLPVDSAEDEQIEIFPSIPDQLLQEMGLLGDETRINPNDEEIEKKFATLSLAFSIDSTTIRDRCQRQRRNRDQTEKNLAVEIERLTERVNRLNRLCIDMETTELLATLLTQIDIVTNASALATCSAEKYGAVQHEEKLSEAVKLMIHHVKSLAQQRDLSRKQLQYTKRVLQDSDYKYGNKLDEKKNSQQSHNEGTSTRRRASIAIATLKEKQNVPEKSIARRTSELAFRTNAISKVARHSRMDLGVDLVKIKEGKIEHNGPVIHDDHVDITTESENVGCEDSDEEIPKCERTGIYAYIDFEVIQKKAESAYKIWSDNGVLSHLFYMCSMFCFCFAIIIMADALFELELSKR